MREEGGREREREKQSEMKAVAWGERYKWYTHTELNVHIIYTIVGAE